MYSDSIFLFCVEESVQNIAEYEAVTSIGKYQFKYLKNTPVAISRCEGRELLIYGYAVDVNDGTYEDIAEKILDKSETLDDVIACEESLGGKYLLIYSDVSGTYVIPDATASVPFCYTTEESPLICACDSEYIARKLGFNPDAERLEIRQMGELSQAMPYDLTVYKQIKHLLPNHYFSFAERKSVRFVNYKERKNAITAGVAAAKTAPLIENLLKYYMRCFKLYCPITSGRDSRVVLSFMLSQDENVETYTMKHSDFSEEEPDIVIPRQIVEKFSINYRLLYDTEPPAQVYQNFAEMFGKTGYSRRTLIHANTIKNACGDGAILNGDIIDQVGKCSSHRDIPCQFAGARYFRCKLHNYSKASVMYLNQWIDEIKKSCEQVSLFDLFSIENRMGRWAAQSNLVYSLAGQRNLNVFNSRSIIYPWTLVPRKDRMLSKIHVELINRRYPSLLDVSFGEDRSIFEIVAKRNGIYYYLASFVKYYVEKHRFFYKNKIRRNRAR